MVSSLIYPLSTYCNVLQSVCAHLSGFMSYIVLTNPYKMDKWLKNIPAKRQGIEDTTNNVSTDEWQENGRADTCPTPSTGS